MKKLLLSLFIIILSSCGFFDRTEDEQKGLEEVVSAYGGHGETAIGFETGSNGKLKYLEVELSKSEIANKRKNRASKISSNVAFLMFRNLSNESKSKYAHIRGTVLFANEEETSNDFTIDQLELIEKKHQLISNIISLSNDGAYNDISKLIDASIMDYDKDMLLSDIQKADEEFGKINDYLPAGFELYSAENYSVIRIDGILLRERENSQFSVWLLQNQNDNRVLGIDYNWNSIFR